MRTSGLAAEEATRPLKMERMDMLTEVECIFFAAESLQTRDGVVAAPQVWNLAELQRKLRKHVHGN